MTGQEKAAVLLLRLPTAEADSVLTRLDAEHRERLRGHMERFRRTPPPAEVIERLLDDLDHLLRDQLSPKAPAESPAARPLPEQTAEPTPPEAASPAPASAEPTPANAVAHKKADDSVPDEAAIQSDPLAALREMSVANVDRLALALSDEHPRTVALVLEPLDPERGGELLKRLHPEMRRHVSLQLGKDVSVHPDLVNRIVRTVLTKCRTVAEAPAAATGNRFKRMAEMLRRLDKPDRMEILAALEQSDSQAAAQVKEFLYSFDDLLLLEDRSMQKLLAEIDSKSLASALKGASEAIKEKVSNNLSKRARETLIEEMELLGTLPTTTIQQAQKAVVDVIQRLDQAGELTMLQ